MRVEPGIGWGEAKLGSTLRELVRAFGQPTKTEPFDEFTYSSWESQGVQVAIATATKKVVVVTLMGRDPEEPRFSTANLDGSDLAFGMSQAQLTDALGEPTAVYRDPNRAWSQLTFSGLNLRRIKMDGPARRLPSSARPTGDSAPEGNAAAAAASGAQATPRR